jgi:Flp pilus assembly protein TadB
MTQTDALFAAVSVAALLGGIMLAIVGAVGTEGPARPTSRADHFLRDTIGLDLDRTARYRRFAYLGSGVFALAGVWEWTGVPTAGIVAGVAVLAVPWLFGAGRQERRGVERIEAIEVWTRRLADLVRAGGGLHQAILASTAEAPAAIAAEVAELASELRGDMSTWDALRRFADRLADPAADEVVAALMLNASQRGPRLADVLDRVCESIGELVTMRREITAERVDARLSGQILSGLTLAGLAMLLLNRSYMRPYHTFLGQVVMLACVAVFVVLLLWMRRLNTPRKVPRLLRTLPTNPAREAR